MRYQVKLTKSEEGVAVSCPGLPGCWSQGATEEEDLENFQDAIVDYLSVVDEFTQERNTLRRSCERCQLFQEYLTKERLKPLKKQGFRVVRQ